MTTALDRYRASMRESEMERTVADLVTLRGGRLFHVRRSDVAPELTDLPDWLIVLPGSDGTGVVILAEAKSVKRALTKGQQEVLELCSQCTRFESYIVRSTNPRDGEIGFDAFVNYLAGEDSAV